MGDGGWGPFQARLWRIAVLVGTLRPVPGHSEGYTTDGPQRGDGGQNSVIGTASRRGPLPHWVGADPIRGTRNIQVWPVGCVLRTCCVRVAGWEPTPAPTALRHGVHRAGATRHARRTRRVQTPSPFKTTRAILFFLRDCIWCVIAFSDPCFHVVLHICLGVVKPPTVFSFCCLDVWVKLTDMTSLQLMMPGYSEEEDFDTKMSLLVHC